MNNIPTLSIGMTSYNQIDYVCQAVESILAQTQKPYEFIVSENWSTDGSYEKLSKYKDKIKIIRPANHLEYREHVNFLISQLKGDYVAIIASDDIYLPIFVETFNSKIVNGCSIVRFGYNIINGEGKLVKMLSKSKVTRRKLTFPRNLVEIISQNTIPIWASAFNKKYIDNLGGFDNRIKFDADWALSIEMAEFGFFQYVPINICNYRANYRSDAELKRLNTESKDAAIISNEIIKNLFKKYNLDMGLWHLSLLQNLKTKIDVHKKYNLEYNYLFDLYKVDEKEFLSFNFIQAIILKFRTKYLNR